MEGLVVAATECPHYITLVFVIQSGQDKHCAGCLAKPIVVWSRQRGNQHTLTTQSRRPAA